MPKPVLKQFTAWSFSRWHDYRQCAYRAKLKYLDKLPEPPNAAMERGTAIHAMAAEIVDGVRTEVPPELQTFAEEFQMVQQLTAKEAEKQVAFTRYWLPTEWFHQMAWVRVVIDMLYVRNGELHIVDFKTGREQPYHQEQLSLYALGGMIIYPEAPIIISDLWYVDQGKLVSEEYSAEEHEPIKQAWEGKVQMMMTDTLFEPTPGDWCRWCAFSKSKGGPCQY